MAGLITRFVAVYLLLFMTATSVYAQTPPDKEAEALMNQQIEAVKDGDYERFVKSGNRAFKELTDMQSFDALELRHREKLEEGYRLEHLGVIERLGMQEHLWKVHLTGKRYQLLGRVSVSQGQMVGFDRD